MVRRRSRRGRVRTPGGNSGQ